MTIRSIWILASAGICVMSHGCKNDTSVPDQELAIPSLSATVISLTEAIAARDAFAAEESVTIMESEVLATFDECWRAYNEKDRETLNGCYAQSAVGELVDHVPPQVAKSREAILAMIEGFWSAFPDIHSEAQLVLVNGRNIAAIVHMEGTNSGPLWGMPATGRPISLLAGQTVTVNDSREVVSDRHWNDQNTMKHQLGMPGMVRSPDAEKKWPATIRIVAGNTASEAANLALARKMQAALNRGDQKEYLAHIADDIQLRYVADRELVRGKSALRKMLAKWSQMANYESQIQSRWAAGDWVVSASQNVATMKAGSKNGKSKKVGTEQLCFARIANSEVKALWIFENTAAYTDQEGNMTSAEHKDEMSTKPARLKAGSLSLH